MYLYSENIYTPYGFQNGYLKIENGKVMGIFDNANSKEIINYDEKVIIPGFIDIHLHGWATGSFLFEGTKDSLKSMSKELVKVGVTSYLATTGTDSINKIASQLVEGKKFIDSWNPNNGAEILGFHLEGPFINSEYRGMQKEEFCIEPSIEILNDFIKIGGLENIKLITMAPELPGSKAFIKYAKANGIQISIGHSGAKFEDIAELKSYGISGFTHMFSGMSGFHHRKLGAVGAAMYFDDMYVEFEKQTGVTVKPEAFKILYKIKGKDKIILATDCIGLAHIRAPFYHYIHKCKYIPYKDKIVVKHDYGVEECIYKNDYNRIKGLELSYIESIKNVVKNVNASISDIVKMACENPAKYIGAYTYKGSIEKGKDADLIIIDEEWNIFDVYVKGKLQNISL